ncbi:MAG: hypothetical protein ACTSP4_00665 [Candidatus Hodarchaeales archaeon]
MLQNLFLTSVNGGIVSNRLYKSPGLANYNSYSYETRNFIPTLFGGKEKRIGTYHGVSLSSGDKKVIYFKSVSEEEFYLVLNDTNIKPFKINKDEVNGNSITLTPIVEIPHEITNIEDIKYQEVGNSLIIVEKETVPKLLKFTGSVFTIDDYPFTIYPIRIQQNNIQIKASGNTIIATDSIFTSEDVGKYFIMLSSSTGSDTVYAYGKVTGFTSSTVLDIEWIDTYYNTAGIVGSATDTYVWRMGGYGGSDEYPINVSLVNGRLVFGNILSEVFSSHVSSIGDFSTVNFKDGSVLVTYGVYTKIQTEKNLSISYITGNNVGLNVGTTNGLFVLRGTQTSFFSSEDIRADLFNNIKCSNINPIKMNNEIICGTLDTDRLNSISYVLIEDGYKSKDISILAQNKFNAKIKEMDYIEDPYQILFTLNENGKVFSLVHSLEQNMNAISEIDLIHNDDCNVLSLSCGSSVTSFLCERISETGDKVYSLELLSDFLKEDSYQERMVYLDNSTTMYDSKVIDKIEIVNPSNKKVFNFYCDESGVNVSDVYFVPDIGDVKIKKSGTVTAIGTGFIQLTFIDDLPITEITVKGNFTKYMIYRKNFSVSDISYLDGQKVDIVINSNKVLPQTVSGGALDLSNYEGYWFIQVGYIVKTYDKSVPFLLSKEHETLSQVINVSINRYQSLGGSISSSGENSNVVDFNSEVAYDTFVDWKSDTKDLPVSSGTNEDTFLEIIHEEPNSFNISNYFITFNSNQKR